jgi:hypothetical protein
MEGPNSNLEKEKIKIADIEPITESRNTEIKNREDLVGLVEGPLLSACQELYDKNIRTTSTSANKNNIQSGFVGLDIEFDTLSDRNREIGKTLGEVSFFDGMNILHIDIPITASSTFGEVQAKAEEIARKFERQPYSVITYTLQDLRKFYSIDPDDESFGPESFSDYYWSPEHQLFFLSEEQFKKATEFTQKEGEIGEKAREKFNKHMGLLDDAESWTQ